MPRNDLPPSAYANVFARHVSNPAERRRLAGAVKVLRQFRPYLCGRVLDFGASYGLSMLALAEVGMTDTWGVEPDLSRVELGKQILLDAGLTPTRLKWTEDTRHLPFPDEHFDTVLALAVFEHIPQPRREYIREVWRVLRPDGCLVIAETPNRYFPLDSHTTGLPFIPWLPSRIAHSIAKRWGTMRQWYEQPGQWAASGWRGLGHYELTAALTGRFEVEHEITRLRHRVLRAVGLPSGLIDPYPNYVIRKTADLNSGGTGDLPE